MSGQENHEGDPAETPGASRKRPSLDQYLMALARAAATRSTCPRKRVGAVVASREGRVLSTGYNGSPPGLEHCDDAGCQLEAGKCVRTVHAEVNALVWADRARTEGGSLYVTAMPCWGCMRVAMSAGVATVIYDEQRDEPLVVQAALRSGVRLIKL